MEEGNKKKGFFKSVSIAQDDRILLETRWLAAVIIPFLVVACIILFFWPNDTDKLFAWTIKPTMTPMMLAAAYLGGIYFFTRVFLAKQWHLVKLGFLPVTVFASLLGIATILHWDRFNHSHISFYVWALLYFTTPFLVFVVWLRNRMTDPGSAELGEVIIPPMIRLFIGVIGVITLAVGLLLFLQPLFMIRIWPWFLTPLTARVVGAMFALPGVVGLGIALEPRWSAARIILEAQWLSIAMILIATARAWSDFDQSNPLTWFFVGGLSFLFMAIAVLYLSIEIHRRNAVKGQLLTV
ncbi:MAG TPA: hypothetical protein VNW73_09995 [Ktedonobacteraceae bacterium]|jgi:hypothetical protein|nr:hypothetical protein [Ktedonobacteraceae bacterium]